MAQFPANIRCSSMALIAARPESTAHSSMNGNMLEVQSTNLAVGARLKVSFRNITAAELASIRSHYEGEGTTRAWLLSAVLCDGADLEDDIATIKWRYLAPPGVVDSDADLHTVNFDLEQVPDSFWIERYVLNAAPVIVRIGAAATLVGPDIPPSLWVSRLTTAGGTISAAGGPYGSMRCGANGETFQAFWCPMPGETGARVVVVKRRANGTIIWQRWTSAAIGGNDYFTRDERAVQVAPAPDGGCVVTAHVGTTRVWRLNGSGGGVWAKRYSGDVNGAVRIVYNNGAIVILSQSEHGAIISPTISGGYLGASLMRISYSTGALLGARVYRELKGDGSFVSAGNWASDLIVLPSGRMVMKFSKVFTTTDGPMVFFLEVSEDTATIHTAAGYSNGVGDEMRWPLAALPDGGYLACAADGFVRIGSDYSVAAHYSPRVNPGTLNPIGFEPLAMKFDDAGNGYFFTYNFASDSIGTGLSISKLANSGATLQAFSEINIGGNIGEPRWQQPQNQCYDIDTATQRGVAQVTNNPGNASCRVTAMGFALVQPGTLATLATGSCSNEMSVLGRNPATVAPGTVANPFSAVAASALSGAITLTTTDADVSMVDASASLTWSRTVLLA